MNLLLFRMMQEAAKPKTVPLCADCNKPIDSAWPGPNGDVCQMCWERICSESWWAAARRRDTWDLIKWRGQVASAIRGKRGQRLLIDLLAALDAMPDKRLIEAELEDSEGEVCALGAVFKARGIDIANIDPEEPEQVAGALDIAPQLAQEIVYENDEMGRETPEERWSRMRRWVSSQIMEAL